MGYLEAGGSEVATPTSNQKDSNSVTIGRQLGAACGQEGEGTWTRSPVVRVPWGTTGGRKAVPDQVPASSDPHL